MMERRTFLKASLAAGVGSLLELPGKSALANPDADFAPVVISSGNGLRAATRAMELIRNGSDALEAVVEGVVIVEDDPADHSVGYGGIPNEEGVVELDASVMHGPTHRAGAVASLQNIKNPSRVAKLVMERSDHVLLVGEGALKFACAHGFKEENLLTDEAREIWLYWKESRDKNDDWFGPEGKDIPEHIKKYFGVTGTITCLGLDTHHNLSGVTTTSGLSFKIPGRVGDSPIIGAGLYVDNEIGACGSTGRGEENLKNLTSFLTVYNMAQGASPKDACLESLKRLVSRTKHASLINSDGSPNFNISLYAINKQGQYGGASIYGPMEYAVSDGKENRRLPLVSLYDRSKKGG
jgi:N4-(beta-N-acetylglucosaminyl)-L-asparaginase